jgi:hypothetical protein
LEHRVSTLEYKTILLPYKPSNFQADNFDIQEALNIQAGERWKLVEIVLPSTIWGRANGMIAILERAKT